MQYFCYTYLMNTFSDPAKIIADLHIYGGQQVADFGAGHGVYTFELAKKVAANPGGHVFAIDVQKNLLNEIYARAERENNKEVKIVWGDIEEDHGSHLRDNSIDFVLIANTLFQLEDKKAALREAYRILKKEGKLLIVDWSESFGNIGPHDEHILSQSTAETLAHECGFIKDKNITAGEHHYGFLSLKN